MNWSETLLQKLTEWRPAGPGRHAFATTDSTSGWTAAVEADRNDELGCLLWELNVRRSSPAAGSLQAWADAIAARVSCLIEPLKVIEVDSVRNEALLRSALPTQRGPASFYFEVLLKGTSEATLRRFQFSHEDSKPRTHVNAPMTHEALVRFVADVVAL